MSHAGPLLPAGDDAAARTLRVQQLFVTHQSKVMAFILSLHPQFDAADDILQETFLVITRKADTFAESTNFLAWACTVARFKVLEHRRRVRQDTARLSDEAVECLAAALPDDRFFEEHLAALRQCLHRLAPHARELVWLRYHGGQEPEEIARRIGWSPGGVRVALSRARALLRKCVELRLAKGNP